MSYRLSKASIKLGKMPQHVRRRKINSFSEYYKTGKSVYHPRMANTVIQGMDYVDLSAEKLFFKHRKVRALADLEGKRKLVEPDPPLLPREPMSHKGSITPYPQKPPSDVIAAGLREIHRQSSYPSPGRQPSSSRASTAPKSPRDFISIHGRTLGRRAKTSVAGTRHRSSKVASRSEGSPAMSRPQSAIDNKLCITVDEDYMDVLRDHQRINYRIHRHFDPHKNHLGDIDFVKGGASSKPCGIQTTTQWLTFSGMVFDPDKAGHVVNAFTDMMEPSQECYAVEQSTGCVVAHQMSKRERRIIIGVNGKAPPSHTRSDHVRVEKASEDLPVPLSWDDLMKKEGVKCVDTRAPVTKVKPKERSSASERRLVWFKKDNPDGTRRPNLCEASMPMKLREQEMMNSTRHTRALERSPYTKVVGQQEDLQKSNGNDCLSYDDVVELLRLQAMKKLNGQQRSDELNQHNTAKTDANEQVENSSIWNSGFNRAFCGTPQSTPRQCSPLLSPTGSGLAKPISANSFRPCKETLQISLSSDEHRGLIAEGKGFTRNSARNGRLHTGNILHKTCAAQGASVGRDQRIGADEQESAAYIHFINPLIRPQNARSNNIDHIHEVATSMVRERSVDSRTEFVEPQIYPNTPVSQPFDDFIADDSVDGLDGDDKGQIDSGRPPSEADILATDVESIINFAASEINNGKESDVEVDLEASQPHTYSEISVNIPRSE